VRNQSAAGEGFAARMSRHARVRVEVRTGASSRRNRLRGGVPHPPKKSMGGTMNSRKLHPLRQEKIEEASRPRMGRRRLADGGFLRRGKMDRRNQCTETGGGSTAWLMEDRRTGKWKKRKKNETTWLGHSEICSTFKSR